jgi:hypothetical protein
VRSLSLTPYVDFAIWSPFGRKSIRAMKFRAYFPLPDGTCQVKELPGPANYCQWLSSWRVFAVAAIMLGIVTSASLHCYERAIEGLTKQWPKAWHLIVMADDKCRGEHLERIRRRLHLDQARGASMPPDWVDVDPWSC